MSTTKKTTAMADFQWPEPIDAASIECPSWCTVDHSADSYARAGHVVHRAIVMETMEHGRYSIELWHPTVNTGKPLDEPVQVHLSGLFVSFTDSEALRRHASAILGAADLLDSINGASA